MNNLKPFMGQLWSRRSLYSASSLGIETFLKARNTVRTNFVGLESKFRDRMSDFSGDGGMVFTEDLKLMIYLADEEKRDMDLVKDMLSKFSAQNKAQRFGSFVFGPVVMRMYHLLNKPVDALNTFMELEENGFFDQISTYQILMDLLLRNGMYKEVIQVFEKVKNKQLNGSRYHKNPVVLVLAACYKLNSPESFDYAKRLWSELNKAGHVPMRRAGTFAAALALSLSSPHVALEILSSIRNQGYVTVMNLKVAALVDLGRADDALPVLKAAMQGNGMSGTKRTILKNGLEKVKESLRESGTAKLTEDFEAVEKKLRDHDLISNQQLDEILCTEIQAYQSQTKRDYKLGTQRSWMKIKTRQDLKDIC